MRITRKIRKLNNIKFIILLLWIFFLSVFINSTYAQSCSQRAGWKILSWQTVKWYSQILWSMTWQNYTNCDPFSWSLTCISSGNLIWNYSYFKYTISQCSAWIPKNCKTPRWVTLVNWASTFWFSATWVSYPWNCNDIMTSLSCVNGMIKWNNQTYKYSSCIQLNPLVSWIDLAIDKSPWLLWSWNIVAQNSTPTLKIRIRNNGDTLVNSATNWWFLKCVWLFDPTDPSKNIKIYESNPISTFVLNPGTELNTEILINNIFTKSLWAKIIRCEIYPNVNGINDINISNNIRLKQFEVVKSLRFDIAINKSIEKIQWNLDSAEPTQWAQGVQNFVFEKVMSILVPLVIIIGVLISIIWFYKIFFSSEDTAVKDWTKFVIYWVIWIILIMSARYIWTTIYSDIFMSWTAWLTDINGVDIARSVYDKIAFPFIKFAIYLVLGGMFVVLASRVFTFLFGTEEDAKKKAWTIIGRNILAMLIIIWAKQIVEAIYWKYNSVVNKGISNIWDIWSWILADKTIPIIYQVINRVLWLTSLVILIIVIFQTVQLLMKPDDPNQIKKMKNTLLYIFIWILIIWAWYLIANFLVIN